MEEFIIALYHLVKNCDYGELQNEMIHDQIVVGIKDSMLSQCLQMEMDWTLKKAKTTICQREAVKEHSSLLGSTPKMEKSVDYVQRQHRAATNASNPQTCWETTASCLFVLRKEPPSNTTMPCKRGTVQQMQKERLLCCLLSY